LDVNDSDEDCTTIYKPPVSQHNDSLYYSESEGEIMEERMEKICHQKENLDFLQKINVYNSDHVTDDVEYI
jgi:hypothetical protein